MHTHTIAVRDREAAKHSAVIRAILLAICSVLLLLTMASSIFAAPSIQESSSKTGADVVKQEISALDVELVLAVAETLEKSKNYEGALQRYAEALDLAQSIGDTGQLVFILDNMGRLQRNVEEYADSNQTFTELLALRESLNDAAGEVETLSLIGANYAALDQSEKALEHLSAALERASAIDDTQLVLDILITTAGVHQSDGAYQNALAAYEKARTIVESVGDLAGVAKVLAQTGALQYDMKAYSESNETLSELLTLQNELGDQPGVIKTLSQISTNYIYLGQDDDAATALDQAVQLSLDADEADQALSTLRAAIKVYEKEKDYDRALAAHSLSLEIAETISDTKKIADSLAGIGSIQRKMEMYEASNETFGELLALQEGLDDVAGDDASKTLSDMGANFVALGDNAKAISAFEESVERALEADNTKQVLATLYDLAGVYADTQAYDKGIQVYETALGIAVDQGTVEQVMDVLKEMSRLQRKAKQYAESNETLTQLLSLQEDADDLAGQVSTLTLLGTNHADLGSTQAANRMFDRSTEVALRIDNVEMAVNAFHAKADLYHELEQYVQEAEQYAAAVSVAKEAGEWLLAAQSAEKMGNTVYKNLQRNDEATAAYQQASDLYQLAGDGAAQVSALMAAAKLLTTQRQIDEALSVYDQAIQTSKTAGELELEVQAQIEKGDTLRQQNRGDEALDVFELALSRAQLSSNPLLVTDVLQYIAKINAGKRHYEEALQVYQQILDILASHPDIDLETNTRRSMWTILIRTGQPDAANAIARRDNGIIEPVEGGTVSELVRISGLAQHPEFRKWQLDLLIDGNEENATFLAFGERPVWGRLTTWDSTTIQNGRHALRLRVVRIGGDYDEFFTPITIQN